MSYFHNQILGVDNGTALTLLPFAVRLDEGQSEPLTLRLEAGRVVGGLRPIGLNRRAVLRWLERHEIPWLAGASEVDGERLSAPLLQLATLVICADLRVRDIAALYAQAAGASLCLAQSLAEVSAAIEQAESHESVSLFLLNERLEEPLCQAVVEANRRRRAAGKVTLSYGFLSAFTPEQLAWLVVKSWVLFLRPHAARVGFAQWDFSRVDATARFRSARTGATHVQRNDAPWLDDEITMLGLRAHGAPFDVSMGRVVLCGKLDPPLPAERTLRAPSCFHDNVCFRMKAKEDAPTEVLRAVDASPLVWCLDSCASLPLTGNAFGNGTSYAFGLVAGAAVGVIGPFLDVMTQGAMNRHCEALLATGASLGRAVTAACSLEESDGFDKFLLIGSPDLRFLPVNRLEPQQEGKKWRYRLCGQRQYAWRLAIPPDLRPPVYVVGNDGGVHWERARCHWFEDGANRDLVVTLHEPADVDGWLLLGSEGNSNQQLYQEATRLLDNLKVLTLCPFVDPKSAAIERCRALTRLLRRVVRAPDRLQCRLDATVLMVNLQLALNALHREVADAFLAQVAAHDVNLDRIPGQGFELEPTERTNQSCPTCGVALYVTQAVWRRKRSYVRRWSQCVNCSGLAMVLKGSPLAVRPPVATTCPDEASLSITMEISNTADVPVQAMVAGLARQGSPNDAAGPVDVITPPGSTTSLRFNTPLDPRLPGVISYRLLVLCDAGVELFALKHVVEPATATAFSRIGLSGQ
jgi:hypothetical protein